MITRTNLGAGGIDGDTGRPVSPREVEEILLERLAKSKKRRVRELKDGVDANDLSQAGWGVVVSGSDRFASESLDALEPLLKLRREQAGSLYKIYAGEKGYVRGEDKLDFLARMGAGPGRVDPKKVPYYLLLVGSPEDIPFEFQYGLDHHHAVGRVHFETPEAFAAYAAAVVAAEDEFKPSPKVAFFGPCQDAGTEVSNERLLKPLIEELDGKPGCQCETYLAEKATKERLRRLLGGDETPDLLFSAGHGVYYKNGHVRQRSHQGALVCQDWPCTEAAGPEHVFSAADLDGPARLLGLIAFLFACNSAGTPVNNDFASRVEDMRAVSPKPFVSSLAQRLLSHPDGGALAVIGHVEQVWQQSFLWRDTGSQILPFVETMNRLLGGGRVGWAMEPLNQRFSDISTVLGELLKKAFLEDTLDRKALAELWIESQDARNYVVVGDPAVRLRTAGKKKRMLRSLD